MYLFISIVIVLNCRYPFTCVYSLLDIGEQHGLHLLDMEG